jgi:hypothetical protein
MLLKVIVMGKSWRLKDPDFLKEADETGIRKFVEWIIEKVS